MSTDIFIWASFFIQIGTTNEWKKLNEASKHRTLLTVVDYADIYMCMYNLGKFDFRTFLI